VKTEVRSQKSEVRICKPDPRTLNPDAFRVLPVNRQKTLKVDLVAIRKLAEFFLGKSAQRAGLRWGEVSVVLVDDRKSQEINRAALGHDYPTDVISFNFAPLPGEDPTACNGEIVVNAEMALRLGGRYGGVHRELALYLAHGCDHLSGADDATPAERMTMRRRELRWLKEAEKREVRVRGSGLRTHAS